MRRQNELQRSVLRVLTEDFKGVPITLLRRLLLLWRTNQVARRGFVSESSDESEEDIPEEDEIEARTRAAEQEREEGKEAAADAVKRDLAAAMEKAVAINDDVEKRRVDKEALEADSAAQEEERLAKQQEEREKKAAKRETRRIEIKQRNAEARAAVSDGRKADASAAKEAAASAVTVDIDTGSSALRDAVSTLDLGPHADKLTSSDAPATELTAQEFAEEAVGGAGGVTLEGFQAALEAVLGTLMEDLTEAEVSIVAEGDQGAFTEAQQAEKDQLEAWMGLLGDLLDGEGQDKIKTLCGEIFAPIIEAAREKARAEFDAGFAMEGGEYALVAAAQAALGDRFKIASAVALAMGKAEEVDYAGAKLALWAACREAGILAPDVHLSQADATLLDTEAAVTFELALGLAGEPPASISAEWLERSVVYRCRLCIPDSDCPPLEEEETAAAAGAAEEGSSGGGGVGMNLGMKGLAFAGKMKRIGAVATVEKREAEEKRAREEDEAREKAERHRQREEKDRRKDNKQKRQAVRERKKSELVALGLEIAVDRFVYDGGAYNGTAVGFSKEKVEYMHTQDLGPNDTPQERTADVFTWLGERFDGEDPADSIEEWHCGKLMCHVFSTRAECHAAVENWGAAFTDQQDALKLVDSHLGQESPEYGGFQLNLILYAHRNKNQAVVETAAATYYTWLMEAYHRVVHSTELHGPAALALVQNSLSAVHPWASKSHLRTALAGSAKEKMWEWDREVIAAKARIEFGCTVWWGLICAVMDRLDEGDRMLWRDKLAWFESYAKPLTDARALELICPGPASYPLLKEKFVEWHARATVSLVLRGGEPEEWAKPFTMRAPLYAMEVIQAVLLPYLHKAKERFPEKASTAERDTLHGYLDELLTKVETRLSLLQAAGDAIGKLEQGHNEVRRRQVEEWKALGLKFKGPG